MENNISKIVHTAIEPGKNILKDVIGVFMHDPNAAWSLTENLKRLPSTIRDEIFWDCLETFILNSYDFNKETNRFEAKNLQSLAVALAEASPNADAGYHGDPEKLTEYAKRLIKLIDDCGTKQKAYYLACLARALLSKEIDTRKFFQLSRCIINLMEEDLLFLSKRIKPGNISRDEDYVDDYRALGLIYETDEGFSYSMRAFELKKYVLCYENHPEIPDSFPTKYEPYVMKEISTDKMNAIMEGNKVKENQQCKTSM